jgi:hypothetical protein
VSIDFDLEDLLDGIEEEVEQRADESPLDRHDRLRLAWEGRRDLNAACEEYAHKRLTLEDRNLHRWFRHGLWFDETSASDAFSIDLAGPVRVRQVGDQPAQRGGLRACARGVRRDRRRLPARGAGAA